MIKQLLNSVVAKYRVLPVVSGSIICQNTIFVQLRPVTVNYLTELSYLEEILECHSLHS